MHKMKFWSCLTLLLVIVVCQFQADGLFSQKIKNIAWNMWKTMYNKSYMLGESALRKQQFMKNFDLIKEHNNRYKQGLETYATRLNKFSDLSPMEFAKLYRGFKKNSVKRYSHVKWLNLTAPESINWTEKGYVTPIKDQGSCGSCWAFSTTGSIEGQVKVKTGKLISLSEQQLVDCSGREGNQGCDGGLMDNSFKYLMHTGIESEERYKYLAQETKCHYKKKYVVANITGYFDVPLDNEEQLKMAVGNVGPISVAIDASSSSFMSYSHGIYKNINCSSHNLDHAVLVVGYGESEGKKYWIIKNSWGPYWGELGYFKMAREDGNMCGVASMASYPTI